MNEEQKNEVQSVEQPEQPPHPEHDELHDLLTLVREYAMPIAVGLGLVLAVFLGFSAYRSYKESLIDRAAANLLSAQSVNDLENIVSQYGDTPSAPEALLKIASEYLHGGQYPMAKQAYARFEVLYPEHSLRATAKIGQAYSLEAERLLEQADFAFQAFSAEYPDHFMTPMAIFGRARCQEQMGNFDAARQIYIDFIADQPENPWIQQAETALLYVDKDKRAAAKTD